VTAQHQVRVRLTLPRNLHAEVAALPPALRSQAVSTVLVAAAEGMDLRAVIAATDQLRRAGVLLNQAVHYCHVHGQFDARAASAVVGLIERLRGRA
jgi:hypothetical protein